MVTVTKSYSDLPAAHRQPGHDGHCRLIHGHNWGFDISFGCVLLDDNGFVVDVGKLKPVKEMLEALFDHTLLLNEDDALLLGDKVFFEKLGVFSKVVVVPNCGMEGLAKHVAEQVGLVLAKSFAHCVAKRGLRVLQVVCWEDSKNCATYRL